MTVAETISQKVVHLPIQDQEEVLELVEQIEVRCLKRNRPDTTNGNSKHPLDLLAEIRIDGPPDLSERHDFYAHGKLED